MKKIYSTILSVLTVGAVLTASAQQQPTNGDFESWDGNGDPTGWSDMRTGVLCSFCGFGSSQRIFEDNGVVHNGNASVRIETTEVFGSIINGTMTTGQIHAPSTTPSEGFAQTHVGQADFNHLMTDMPDSLVFYAQYNETGTSDSASVAVTLHDNSDYRDPNGDDSQVIAYVRKRFQTAGIGNWVRISAPFDYSGGSSNPIAYALMTFTSSYQPGAGSSSAKLWVDDFEFIYNPDLTGVEELADVVGVYPNPTNDGRITINLGYDNLTGSATVLNMMGQTVGLFNFSNENKINVEINQPTGMYFINLQTENGRSTTVRVVKS
ncbi:MAG: hypothetical protein ACI8P5_000220 [Bacteroidia bacterium]|jgi:hypothetical protein